MGARRDDLVKRVQAVETSAHTLLSDLRAVAPTQATYRTKKAFAEAKKTHQAMCDQVFDIMLAYATFFSDFD